MLVAFAALVGSAQLVVGVFTPPISDLQSLGLSTWVLPGIWLFASVAVPSAAAAVLLARRSPVAPTMVIGASALLAFEVLSQIPFLGPSALQAVMGAVAVGLGVLAVRSRRQGWGQPPP